MSGDRQTDNTASVDQGARNSQIQQPVVEERVLSQEDVIADLKKQMEDLEARDRQREEDIKSAQQQRDAERRAREAAEARARDADQRARTEGQTGRNTAEDAQLDALKAGIDSSHGKMAALKTQYANFSAEGAFDKAADVQAEMSLTAARLTQLEAGKTQLEARKATRGTEQPQVNGRDATAQPATEYEAQEQFIRQQPTIVQAWLRDHRDRYFGDREFQLDITAAARLAQRGNIAPDTQRYIEFIEEQVGLRQPARRDDLPPARDQQQTQPAGRDPAAERQQNRMVTAPAGGSVGNTMRTDNVTTVYLTPEEKEQARRDGISESDWAKAKADLIREGQIGPNARNR